MDRQKLPRKTLLLAAALCLVALPATGELAEINIGTTAVNWHPSGAYEGLVLTISGPGDLSIRHELAAGEAPSFGLFDEYGKALADGGYVWELRLIPALDSETRAALEEARALGDDSIAADLRAAGKLPVETVQSGHFTIHQGSFVNNAAVEPKVAVTEKAAPVAEGELPPTKDQQILDDLIVDGSICAGQDCVNGESFGFDTLRLKENNLRIKFQDTSNSASFPTVDWQLTANDSTNGGQNKFSVDDIDGGRTPFTIEAGAQANNLYVESDGDVGIKTANPVVDLHIVEGNTPTLRLEQDGSDGFTPQTWDVAGNESNFFIRDVTNGSRLSFRIRPSAPESSIDIAGDGDVGLGTSSPNSDLHIRDTGTTNADNHAQINLEANGNSWLMRTNFSSGQFNWINNSSGGNEVPLRITNTATNNLLQLGVDANNRATILGDLDVDGVIYQRGGVLHADYVFEDDYELESIEEHAEFMWTKKHLPAVPKAEVDDEGREVVRVGAHRRGMLEELEKAHIYIDQLHKEMQEMKTRLEKLEGGE